MGTDDSAGLIAPGADMTAPRVAWHWLAVPNVRHERRRPDSEAGWTTSARWRGWAPASRKPTWTLRPKLLWDWYSQLRAACALRRWVACGLVPSLGACARTRPAGCLLYTSPSPRDGLLSRMPSSA